MKRVVLAGLGVRGNQWREALRNSDAAELACVVEVSSDPAVKADVPVFSTMEKALSTEPDAVIVATPPETHLDLVRDPLKAGIPVLCEKPLSESFEEARSMSVIADEAATTLLVGMNFRFVPASQAMRRIVRDQTLGEPMFAQFTYIRNRDGRRKDLNSYPLTMREPMLFEQSVHHVDLMRYVYDREVVSVSARSWNPSTSIYRSNSSVVMTLVFEGDLVVSYLGTWTSGTNRFDFRWRTDFQRGVTIQPDQFGDLLVARLETNRSLTGLLFDPIGEPLKSLGVGPSEPFAADTAALLQHFLNVVDGSEPPGPTAEDHLATLNLLEAISLASRENRTVDVAEIGGFRDA